MNRKTKWSAALGLILLLVAAAWAYRANSTDPQVAALEAQRDVMFSGNATEEQRVAFRNQVEQLTDDQRRQLFERGRPDMRKRMAERMNELFSQSEEELRAEARQRAADIVANRKQRAAGGDDRRGGPPGGGPPRGEGRGNRTEAEREARAKQRLDFVDPGTRAQFSEFRKMIDEELKAKGQEPLSGRDMRAVFRGGRDR